VSAQPTPGRTDRAKQHGRNFKTSVRQSPVKRVLVNSLHMAFVNTTAAFASEFLNFYLEAQGLNQRRVSIAMVPNPDKPTPQNPLKRSV